MIASPEQPRSRLWRHAGFGFSLLIGLGLAALVYLFLAISECLPRNGSPEMLACDAIKRREAWLYPALLAVSVTGAITLHIRGAARSWLMAMASGLMAAVALTVINALTG